MLNIFLFDNRAVYEITWKNIVSRHDTDDNMVRARCMLVTR